jgi:hypothetical protein
MQDAFTDKKKRKTIKAEKQVEVDLTLLQTFRAFLGSNEFGVFH